MVLVHFSADRVALSILTGYASMGWDEESYTILSIDKSDSHILLHTNMSENNSSTGSQEATDWVSTVRLIPRERKYHDILFHRKGTLKGKSIDYTITYRYDGDTYRPDNKDIAVQN